MSFRKISRDYTERSNLILIFLFLAMTFRVQCDFRFFCAVADTLWKLVYLEILI